MEQHASSHKEESKRVGKNHSIVRIRNPRKERSDHVGNKDLNRWRFWRERFLKKEKVGKKNVVVGAFRGTKTHDAFQTMQNYLIDGHQALGAMQQTASFMIETNKRITPAENVHHETEALIHPNCQRHHDQILCWEVVLVSLLIILFSFFAMAVLSWWSMAGPDTTEGLPTTSTNSTINSQSSPTPPHVIFLGATL